MTSTVGNAALIGGAAGLLIAGAVAGAATTTALAGSSNPVSTAATATLTACVNRTTRVMRLVSSCTRYENRVVWNIAGPRGATGLTGARGLRGATGAPGAKGDPGDSGSVTAVLHDSTGAKVTGLTAIEEGTFKKAADGFIWTYRWDGTLQMPNGGGYYSDDKCTQVVAPTWNQGTPVPIFAAVGGDPNNIHAFRAAGPLTHYAVFYQFSNTGACVGDFGDGVDASGVVEVAIPPAIPGPVTLAAN